MGIPYQKWKRIPILIEPTRRVYLMVSAASHQKIAVERLRKVRAGFAGQREQWCEGDRGEVAKAEHELAIRATHMIIRDGQPLVMKTKDISLHPGPYSSDVIALSKHALKPHAEKVD